MESSIGLVESYHKGISHLQFQSNSTQEVAHLVKKFVSIWFSIHDKFLKKWASKSAEIDFYTGDWSSLRDAFLRKRASIISGFVQALQRCTSIHEELKRLKIFLKEHDSLFTKILEKALEDLKKEFSQAVVTKKVLAAYAQSVHFGEVK